MIYVVIIIITILFFSLINSQSEQLVQVQKSSKQIEKENAIIAIIKEAIEQNKKLYIGYKSSFGYSGNEYTERIIIPKSIHNGQELNQTSPLEKGEWISDEFYLFAYCELRKEERHFKIGRIQSIKILL